MTAMAARLLHKSLRNGTQQSMSAQNGSAAPGWLGLRELAVQVVAVLRWDVRVLAALPDEALHAHLRSRSGPPGLLSLIRPKAHFSYEFTTLNISWPPRRVSGAPHRKEGRSHPEARSPSRPSRARCPAPRRGGRAGRHRRGCWWPRACARDPDPEKLNLAPRRIFHRDFVYTS
jgi:hypothetical protein